MGLDRELNPRPPFILLCDFSANRTIKCRTNCIFFSTKELATGDAAKVIKKPLNQGYKRVEQKYRAIIERFEADLSEQLSAEANERIEEIVEGLKEQSACIKEVRMSVILTHNNTLTT